MLFLPVNRAVLRALLCEIMSALASEHRSTPIVGETGLMTGCSHIAQVIVSRDSADSLVSEGIFVDLVVLQTLNHRGLESALDAIAELRALAGTQISM